MSPLLSAMSWGSLTTPAAMLIPSSVNVADSIQSTCQPLDAPS